MITLSTSYGASWTQELSSGACKTLGFAAALLKSVASNVRLAVTHTDAAPATSPRLGVWGMTKHGSPLSRASPGASPEWRLPPDSHAERKAEDKDGDKEDAVALYRPTDAEAQCAPQKRRLRDWKRRLPPWDRFK